jgi:hypothetical protein
MITYTDILEQLEVLREDMIDARLGAMVASVGEPWDGSFVRQSWALRDLGTQSARETLALRVLLILRPELASQYTTGVSS